MTDKTYKCEECDNYSKLLAFVQANAMPHLTEDMLEARKKRKHDDGWMVLLAKECRKLLKQIGEL